MDNDDFYYTTIGPYTLETLLSGTHSPPMKEDAYGDPSNWVCIRRDLFNYLLLEAHLQAPPSSALGRLEQLDLFAGV